MHDDKNEKTIIEKLVYTVKNVASDFTALASDAAQNAMEFDEKMFGPNTKTAGKEKPNKQMYSPQPVQRQYLCRFRRSNRRYKKLER